ncbi:uncharacterized protein [Aquarana catesbeiana]|uniref:uncharacterized protein n=1 Tax=Aquarana catesbeiana TaxID=8400 RepID=UPI003CC93552
MSNKQKNDNIHTVKIQQTYWVKDTSEEKMLALGAVQLGKVVEQVDYYDTDLYDLAVTEMWLSKMGREWKLIVGKGTQNNSQDPPKGKVQTSHLRTQKFNSVGGKNQTSKTSNSKTLESQKKVSINDQNENEETVDNERNGIKALTCYALEQEKEIIAFLSQVLHVQGETNNMTMEVFLQVAGIQRYATISNVTQETFRLTNDYTIQLKTEGTTTKKTAVVLLDVDIENVAQGFQRLEQLAKELDLQLQSV